MNSTRPAEPNAEQLAARSQEGCRDSFERLVEMYQVKIYHYLRHMTGNAHDAEDITQETFAKAYANLHRFNAAYSFSAWLFTIAKRTALTFFRSRKFTEELPADIPDELHDPSESTAREDDKASIWDMAQRLKPKQYEALWLRYGEGFSVAETARIMNTTQIHVKVLLHRGRGSLGQLLAKRGWPSTRGGSLP